jgi:pyrroline-5-carboxylate reductase
LTLVEAACAISWIAGEIMGVSSSNIGFMDAMGNLAGNVVQVLCKSDRGNAPVFIVRAVRDKPGKPETVCEKARIQPCKMGLIKTEENEGKIPCKGCIMNIAFIGGGNMACALIGGLLQRDYSPAQIRVVEVNADARENIKRQFSVEAVPELAPGAVDCDAIVLAVKPQQLSAVAQKLAPLLSKHLVISIAAGLRARDISRWLGNYDRVVRAMPNTPALVGAAATGLYATAGVSDGEKRDAEAVLAAVGTVLWVDNEELLDVVTAVSGSGPAYVFYFMEAMQQAGVELGLDPARARQLTLDTFVGAARLASQSSEDAALLRRRVTSPGGTTERAIMALENERVKDALKRAIRSAYERSREMSDEFGKGWTSS